MFTNDWGPMSLAIKSNQSGTGHSVDMRIVGNSYWSRLRWTNRRIKMNNCGDSTFPYKTSLIFKSKARLSRYSNRSIKADIIVGLWQCSQQEKVASMPWAIQQFPIKPISTTIDLLAISISQNL